MPMKFIDPFTDLPCVSLAHTTMRRPRFAPSTPWAKGAKRPSTVGDVEMIRPMVSDQRWEIPRSASFS